MRRKAAEALEGSYDIIVVGAGSAGCALAWRLAQRSELQVLLLEAGSRARNPMLHIPLGFAFLLKDHANNWGYKTVPEPDLGERVIDLHRGKVLGGCSAINGMVYVRGQAADYDGWAGQGNRGWSYEDVLPLFKRSEHSEKGADPWHGVGGPLWVSEPARDFPICDDFVRAASQAGYRVNPDINGEDQEGVGYFPATIRNGRRWSSATAFLSAAAELDNLTVATGANVQRIRFEGDRARGVEIDAAGGPVEVEAREEVLLCGGAINSPAVLERSGVGSPELLKSHGIDVAVDLPGVGENLHDHWNSYLKCSLKQGRTFYSESKGLGLPRNILRYLFTRRGLLANPAALVAVFYRALPDARRPDSQIHFSPAASQYDARGNMQAIQGITVGSCGVRPTSRGHTHIRDSYLYSPPRIQVNYLQTEYDQRVAIEAFRKVREILQQEALAPYGFEELEPGAAVESDAEILEFIRRSGDPVHHLAGSCRMGQDDMAVVDEQLRVRGTRGLRVADAAIMPEIVSGNTHAACVMIAEKAADLIFGESTV